MSNPEATLEYKKLTDGLLATSRDTRALYRRIKKMDIEQLAEELQDIKVSIHGAKQVIRERLFRARVQEMLPDKEMPWFAEDWDPTSDVSQFPIAWPEDDKEATNGKKKRERKPAATQTVSLSKMSDVGTQTDEDGAQGETSPLQPTATSPSVPARGILTTAEVTTTVTTVRSPIMSTRITTPPPDYSWPRAPVQTIPAPYQWPERPADRVTNIATTLRTPRVEIGCGEETRLRFPPNPYERLGAIPKAPRPSEIRASAAIQPPRRQIPEKRVIKPWISPYRQENSEDTEEETTDN